MTRDPACAAAGAANLAKYATAHPGEANLKHGVFQFLNGGQPPESVAERVEAFKADLISDLGGAPTAAQRALVDASGICLGVLLLGYAWVAEHGAVNSRSGKPARVLNVLASYMNTLRLNLLALGLERREKSVQTLESVLEEYEQKT
jgi:hypothetical protein